MNFHSRKASKVQLVDWRTTWVYCVPCAPTRAVTTRSGSTPGGARMSETSMMCTCTRNDFGFGPAMAPFLPPPLGFGFGAIGFGAIGWPRPSRRRAKIKPPDSTKLTFWGRHDHRLACNVGAQLGRATRFGATRVGATSYNTCMHSAKVPVHGTSSTLLSRVILISSSQLGHGATASPAARRIIAARTEPVTAGAAIHGMLNNSDVL